MEDCWQHMRYGLRVGPWPHVVVSTTPKNRVLIKELVKKAREAYRDPESGQIEVVVTRATTEHNPHLDPRIKRMLFEDYGGTRLGRQELYAEILEDVQGALWRAADIDMHRLSRNVMPTKFDKIAVGVDPAASSLGDECGIVVAGVVGPGWRVPNQNVNTEVAHGFVLADYTIQGSPQVWSREVVRAYDDWGANLVVAEINNGGEMVTHTIHTVRDTIPVKTEHATRGKTRRAEPVALLYEQGRVHHVGVFGKLEDQMTGWDAVEPDDSWSPDRMDAMVWALTNLMASTQRTVMTSVRDTRLRGTR
jgi:phage terminase large subunit-like protein